MHVLIGLAAAIMSAILWGMFWYSPSAFGDIWFRLTFPGKKYDDIKQEHMGLVFLSAIVAQGATMILMHYILR